MGGFARRTQGERARIAEAVVCLMRAATNRMAGAMRGVGAVKMALFLAMVGLLSHQVPAWGQTPQVPEELQKLTAGDTPMLIQADELVFDNKTNTVRAEGRVEIYYKNYVLVADRIVFDRSKNLLTAEGNVRIREPGGSVINADKIQLTDDFREGFVRSLRVITREDVRISAEQAQRMSGNRTVFKNGTYTPCKICKAHPNRPPLWQIKAVTIIHDQAKQTITYENATLEFLGVPVAWIPYFSHPDPSVRRKSGFLIPAVSFSADLGYIAETPYYFALAPNYDFTFTPMFTTRQGVLFKGEWRHRLANGAYKVKLAGIYQLNPDDDGDPTTTLPGERRWRGSLETQGSFSLGSYWTFGWDATLESDDTFRRFYKLDDLKSTDRVSKTYLVGLSERNYFAAHLYHFGGLTWQETSYSKTRVHPVVDYDYLFSDPIFGGELHFTTNVLSLTRDEGTDTHRLIGQVNWRRRFVDGWGQVFTPFFRLRGDVYKVENVVDPFTNTPTGESNYFTRGMGVAGLEYRYPFVSRFAQASHIVEPVAQVITRSGTRTQARMPNEDAQSLVFDETLLFDIDKFSGYDRMETGTRANVGLRYTAQQDNGGYFRAVVGQSYQLAGINSFFTDSGLEKPRSDYILGLMYEPSSKFGLAAQMRFDSDDLSLARSDMMAWTSYGPFSGSVNYMYQRAQPSLGFTTDREELFFVGSVQVVKNWSLFGGLRYDLVNERTISDNIGLKYADECFMFSVNYSETFFRDQDINPERAISFRVELKTLGGFGMKTDQIGGFLANNSENDS